MVVGYLTAIENTLAFAQGLGYKVSCYVLVGFQGLEYLAAFGVDVVVEVAGVYTRIGGDFLLVKALDEGEAFGGGVAVLVVEVYLQ